MTVFKRIRIMNNKGFTLIEILVGMAIAAMMLLSLNTAHKIIIESVRTTSGRSQFYDELNQAMRMIDNDIRCIFFDNEKKNIVFLGKESGGQSSLIFVTVSDQDVCFTGDIDNPVKSSNVRETSYYLREDPSAPGHYLLMKREDRHYDEDFESGGSSSPVLKNVLSLQFFYKKGNTWESEWDSRETGNIPSAVKTLIKLHDYESNEKTYQFISYLQFMQKS